MAIQNRRGPKDKFDPYKMLPGEWAVSIDTETERQIIWMCFRAGVVKRMGTYEDFKEQIAEATGDIREKYEQTFNEIKVYMEGLRDTASSKAAESANSAAVAKISEANAGKSEQASADYLLQAKSYVKGTGGVVRPNDDSDCAVYYYEQTKRISEGINGLVPMGTITFAELSESYNQVQGYMFDISDEFISDERFKNGSGIYYGAGTNVIRTADGYWDALASTSVSGIKGNAETTYRQGFVNITPEDIGAVEKEDLKKNSKEKDGYVPKGEGNGSKFWGTDSEGNPAWRSVDIPEVDLTEIQAGLSGKVSKSGDTMTGTLASQKTTGTYLAGNQGQAIINSNAAAGAYTMLDKLNSTNGYFTDGVYNGSRLLQYTAKSVVDGKENKVTKSVTLLDEEGNTVFPGKVGAAGGFTGNADTATKLQTARTISLTGAVTGQAIFDGSGNISINTSLSASGLATGATVDDVSDLSLTEQSDGITVAWSDPDDVVFNQSTIAQWAGTKLVRKAGSASTGETDGTVLIDNKTKNAYKDGYQDATAVKGTEYYYTLFPYTTKNVYTKSDKNRVSGSVLNYNPVLEENSWEVIAQMSEEGLAKEIWKIGDKKGNYQIVGFNHDDLADGSGKAGITFIYWPTDLKSKWNDKRADYTSILPFYEAYIYKDFLSGIYEGLEINLKSRIKEVTKECISAWDRTTYYATANKNMKLFLFSVKEMSKSATDKLQNDTDRSYRVAIEGVNYEGLNAFSKDTWTRTLRYNSGDGQAIYIDGDYPFNLYIQLAHSVQYGFCV